MPVLFNSDGSQISESDARFSKVQHSVSEAYRNGQVLDDALMDSRYDGHPSLYTQVSTEQSDNGN